MKIQLTEQALPVLHHTHKERDMELTANLENVSSVSVLVAVFCPFSRAIWLSVSARFNSHLRGLIHLSAAYLPPALCSSINQHLALNRAEHYGLFLSSYRLGLHSADQERGWKDWKNVGQEQRRKNRGKWWRIEGWRGEMSVKRENGRKKGGFPQTLIIWTCVLNEVIHILNR